MSEWQPIETAPKDRFILLWEPEFCAIWLAKWQGSLWYGVDNEGITRQSAREDGETICYVTHWMPLPLPPTQSDGKS